MIFINLWYYIAPFQSQQTVLVVCVCGVMNLYIIMPCQLVHRILNNAKLKFFQNEESKRKRQQELDQQRVASQMEELKIAKLELEQEVDTHKKRLRLHMEAQVSTQ